MKSIGKLCLAGAFAGCVISQPTCMAQSGTDPARLLQEPVSPAIRLSYGSNALQFGELRLPPGNGPFPLVILIHGGCWERQLAPDVPEAITSFQLLSPGATSLTAEGYATWNIEYRRVGNDGGGWPNTFLDVGAATDFVRAIAHDRHLDLKRVVILGHSSGGQLALWDAARFKLPKSSVLHAEYPLKVEDVVSVDGPADLAAFWPLQQQMCGAPVITKLMGGSPEQQPKRYSQGAITGLAPIKVPQLLVERREPAPLLTAAQQYVVDAKKKGEEVTLVIQNGRSHFDSINPQSEDWNTVVTTIQRWLGSKR